MPEVDITQAIPPRTNACQWCGRMPEVDITQEVQLLVEGNDERNFFDAFIKYLSISNVQIQSFGGKDKLRSFLLGLVRAPGFRQIVKRVGIVRDADKSAERAFQSVRDSLENASLPAPTQPEEPTRGGDNVAVTVMILPGGNREGMLETLLCETFAGTSVEECIDGFFECVEELCGHSKRPDKARARVYLATKPDPHLSVGVAAKKGYWCLDHDVFGNVRDFLMSLSPPEA